MKKVGKIIYLDIIAILFIIRYLLKPDEFSPDFPQIIYTTIYSLCYVFIVILGVIYLFKKDTLNNKNWTSKDIHRWNLCSNIFYIGLLMQAFSHHFYPLFAQIIFVLFCVIYIIYLSMQIYYAKKIAK